MNATHHQNRKLRRLAKLQDKIEVVKNQLREGHIQPHHAAGEILRLSNAQKRISSQVSF